MKIGFIGYGKMGRALALGAANAGVLKKSSVRAFDRYLAGDRAGAIKVGSLTSKGKSMPAWCSRNAVN